MENLNEGLILMVVGMTTVFVILFVVINLGKCLIALVNKYVPEGDTERHSTAQHSQAVDSQTVEILTETVKTVTSGKGHITNIVKL